jgi:AcrR family transcriptional regulator
VFAEKGFASTTMRDIADAVGILAGSLYHHFTSKDEILAEMLKDFFSRGLEDARALIDRNEDPDAEVVGMCRQMFRYVFEHPAETTIVTNDYTYLVKTAPFRSLAKDAAALDDIWVGVIRRAVAAGKFRSDVDPVLAYRTIVSAIFASVRWYDPRGRIRPESFIEQQTAMFLEGLRVR